MNSVYRFCFLTVLIGASLLFAETPCSRMAHLMQEFTTTIEELAKSAVLLSHDSYFVHDLFLSIIRQNPSIEVIAKIDSSGTTVARMTPAGVHGTGTIVANERWFKTVVAAMRPYCAVWKTRAGSVVLFRAWPLVDPSQSPGRLTGIFAVKIDLKRHMAILLKNETVPVEIRYKENMLVRHKWEGVDTYHIEALELPGAEKLEVRYAVPDNDSLVRDIPPVDEPPQAVRSIPRKKPKANNGLKKMRFESPALAATSFPPTLLADSLFAASSLPPMSSSRIILFILLAGVALVIIIASLVILIRGMFHTVDFRTFYRTLSPSGPIDAIMVPDKARQARSEDTREFKLFPGPEEPVDISGPERETKEL
ncbi:MAG: cache domain-containing protein, partial [Chitinispirillaceae bacterium]|nr:cache domain-containing protein [Chitinispirillaceae bacterium]